MTIEKLPKADFPVISCQDLKALIDSGEDFVLLDIRISSEQEKLWIETPCRLQLSLNEIPDRYAEIPQGKKLVVIDKIGKRTGAASRYLKAKGYDQIVMVGGGLNQWVKSGMPTQIRR